MNKTQDIPSGDRRTEIAILGSTGSIGTQTLDIISDNPRLFRARLLTANHNWQLLAEQALKYRPDRVVIAAPEHYEKLREALAGTGIAVESGAEAIADAVEDEGIDMVVTAMVGYSGLTPTIRAIQKGKTIALANKETLVVGGELITGLLKKHGVKILPVDSEHSAIFQCLEGERRSDLHKIILTASGGPFRTWSRDRLETVTVKDALNHPNWSMGAKVTIDSASMMNKGFEMIEARWLFDCPPEDIEIVVHPQSIVHSMVQYTDGSVKAQLGVPDMHLPIRYALGYPNRLPSPRKEEMLRLDQYSQLTFEAPDYQKFPLLTCAFEAIKQGGNMPCILNAANEVAVAAFLSGKLRFVDMPRLVERVMQTTPYDTTADYATFVATNSEARRLAEEALSMINHGKA